MIVRRLESRLGVGAGSYYIKMQKYPLLLLLLSCYSHLLPLCIPSSYYTHVDWLKLFWVDPRRGRWHEEANSGVKSKRHTRRCLLRQLGRGNKVMWYEGMIQEECTQRMGKQQLLIGKKHQEETSCHGQCKKLIKFINGLFVWVMASEQ